MDFFKKVFKKEEKPKPVQTQSTAQTTTTTTTTATSKPVEKVTREDFESIDVLGKGSFAEVVLCKFSGNGQYYAMKVVKKQGLIDHKRIQDVFTERNILTRSDQPFLLKLHWTFQTPHKLFFVMDYMAGGDFDKYLNTIPNKILDNATARLYAAEVFLSLTYLHEHGVIYRDLKPENILMNGAGHCILADFGLSKDFNQEGSNQEDFDMRATSFVGSPYYVAPDVLKQKEYTEAVDYWSFGVLLYRMLCGRPPFSGRNMKEVFDNIMYTELRFPSSVVVSNEAKDLCSRLLTKDPARRAKADDVRNHPFFAGLSFDDVLALKVAPQNWIPPPSVEQMLEAKLAKQTAESTTATSGQATTADPSTKAVQAVNTLVGTSALSQNQQDLFSGFSCTTDSVLKK